MKLPPEVAKVIKDVKRLPYDVLIVLDDAVSDEIEKRLLSGDLKPATISS